MIANALAGLQALDRGLEPIGRNWESLVSWGSEGQFLFWAGLQRHEPCLNTCPFTFQISEGS